MGGIADKYCEQIILTNEDPYDENPEQIVNEVANGIKNKKVKIIMDRGQAIAEAINLARANSAVLITGKGTDPYIMEANDKRTPWSDANVAREKLEEELKNRQKSQQTKQISEV